MWRRRLGDARCNDLAKTYVKKKSYDKAEALYLRLLATRQKISTMNIDIEDLKVQKHVEDMYFLAGRYGGAKKYAVILLYPVREHAPRNNGLMSALDGLSADENFLEEKALWVLNDKKSAEKPETGFKSWTERVKSLLELAWWPLLFFSTASQMEKSEEDKDAGPIGMLEGIGMRKLLAPRSCQMATENANLFKVSSLDLRQKSSFQDLDVGDLEGKGGVIVEYKKL
ncbi:hypothetical protein WAI453_010262 [Rhynchosporium graminicola]